MKSPSEKLDHMVALLEELVTLLRAESPGLIRSRSTGRARRNAPRPEAYEAAASVIQRKGLWQK